MAKEEKKTLEERQKELQNELLKSQQMTLRLEGALMIINELIEEAK
jgi:hypothetical protein